MSSLSPAAPQAAVAPDTLGAIFAANRKGARRGIYSVCSAHALVLEAAFEAARDDGSPLLIEATCNQVNHHGGYTGMTPVDFRREVEALAARTGFPLEALVLGGDHLGPNPWRHLRAKEAMQEAATMVAAYVAAGFTKIHLDASMACADDSSPLSDTLVAERAAQLCAAAEAAVEAAGSAPVYVVGTEVPVPGGETASEAADAADVDAAEAGPLSHIRVTRAEAIEATLEAHREAFARYGLGAHGGGGGPARRRFRRSPGARLRAGQGRRTGRQHPRRAALRVRGALNRLPDRSLARRPGARPLRDPEGGPRAHLRIARGALRAELHRGSAGRRESTLAAA